MVIVGGGLRGLYVFLLLVIVLVEVVCNGIGDSDGEFVVFIFSVVILLLSVVDDLKFFIG